MSLLDNEGLSNRELYKIMLILSYEEDNKNTIIKCSLNDPEFVKRLFMSNIDAIEEKIIRGIQEGLRLEEPTKKLSINTKDAIDVNAAKYLDHVGFLKIYNETGCKIDIVEFANRIKKYIFLSEVMPR